MAVRVGHFDSGGNNNASTNELRVNNNSVYCNGSISLNSTAYRLEDTGGLYMNNSTSVACNFGLVILPGANQTVSGVFINNSVFDSDNTSDLHIDTGTTSATILEVQFTGSVGSLGSKAGRPFLIENNGGGIMGGVHFSASRFYPRQNTNAIDIKNIAAATGMGNISIRDSNVCFEGAGPSSGTGINLASSVTTGGDLDIVANTIGACDTNGATGTLATGITLASSAIAVSVTSNRLMQNTTPINLSGTTNLFVTNNAGIDDQPPTTVASATSTTISINTPTVFLSGTAAIQNILPAWSGRRIQTINTGNWTFTGGGNVNTGYAGATSRPLTSCVFDGSSWQCQ